MARLAGNAELEGLNLKVAHESRHAFGNGAEVVVVHLLVLGRVMAHERAAGHQQVGACGVEPFVHEKILLLPTEVRDHFLHVGVEELCHGRGGLVHGVEGLLQRSFVIEGFACVGNEDGGDHQRVADDEDRRCGVPGRVAARLKRRANAAAGERTGIGLLLHQLLARELLYHAAMAVVHHEAVVLLGGAFGQGLEPVCDMRDTQIHGPSLHALGHDIGRGEVQRGATVHHGYHFGIHVFGQVLCHLLT